MSISENFKSRIYKKIFISVKPTRLDWPTPYSSNVKVGLSIFQIDWGQFCQKTDSDRLMTTPTILKTKINDILAIRGFS